MDFEKNRKQYFYSFGSLVCIIILIALGFVNFYVYTYKNQFTLKQNDYGKGYFEVKNSKINKEIRLLLSSKTKLPAVNSKVYYLTKNENIANNMYTKVAAGDYVIVYEDAGIAFVIRPKTNELINVGPYLNESNKTTGCSESCIEFE